MTQFDVAATLDTIRGVGGVQSRGGRLRSDSRALLEALLSAFIGAEAYSRVEPRLVTDSGLETLYASACKSEAQGAGVAAALARGAVRPGDNPLLAGTPAPRPESPVQRPTPRPAPVPPESDAPRPTPPAGERYALQSSLDALARLSATKEALDGVQRNLNETERRMARELNLAVDTLRTDTADAMVAIPGAVLAQVSASVTQLVADAIAALRPAEPVTLNVVSAPDAPAVQLGLVHFKTADILSWLAAGENVYLHGPAGSGKTTAARKCAKALGVEFYFAAKVESEYSLLGFAGATGAVVRTQFREAYENGGLFLFDEMDASSPAAVVALNAALANGICPFPDGIIERHKDFYCIGAGNTTLSGANSAYRGRNQLDGSSVDRFVFEHFPYDEALEAAISTNPVWTKYVQAARKAVADRKINHLITPRATIAGCKGLAAGKTVEQVCSAVLWKGLDKDTVQQLEAAITAPKPVIEGLI